VKKYEKKTGTSKLKKEMTGKQRKGFDGGQ
jgi:hypothetical protein